MLIFDDDVDRVIWQELSGGRLELLSILVGALYQLFSNSELNNGLVFSDEWAEIG